MNKQRVRLQYDSEVIRELEDRARIMGMSISQLANRLLTDTLLRGGYGKEREEIRTD